MVRGCSSVGRAPALQAGGHRFDSVHLHHCVFIGGLKAEDIKDQGRGTASADAPATGRFAGSGGS